MKRSYDSPARERQAQATRAEILTVAAALFAAQGYQRTSVAAVADMAGVTAQTIYNAVGSKQALLKAAYDRTLAGDDEPVSMAERPDVRAMYQLEDAVEFLHAYARLGRRVVERVGPLMLQIAAGAAAGEPDLVTHQQVTDGERLVGTGMVVQRVADLGALAAGLTPEVARDRIWTLNSAQVWGLLTLSRGWSGDAYEEWIGEAMCAAVLDPRPGSVA
ncbi:MAG TPA: TetR/AcrR family transcriptional regulator [Microlunatus sp.]|nr:TetR/AcrR family transcriptional regulator [Microlunatus sp.]